MIAIQDTRAWFRRHALPAQRNGVNKNKTRVRSITFPVYGFRFIPFRDFGTSDTDGLDAFARTTKERDWLYPRLAWLLYAYFKERDWLYPNLLDFFILARATKLIVHQRTLKDWSAKARWSTTSLLKWLEMSSPLPVLSGNGRARSWNLNRCFFRSSVWLIGFEYG